MNIYKLAQDSTDPAIVNISAEDMIVDRYLDLLPKVKRKAKGAKGNIKEMEKSIKEIDMILGEITSIFHRIEDVDTKSKISELILKYKKLRQQLGRKSHIESFIQNYMHKSAYNSDVKLDISVTKDLINEYGQKANEVVKKIHPSSIYLINNNDNNDGEIIIRDVHRDPKGEGSYFQDILRIRINDQFLVDSIIPCGCVAEIYPIQSVEFYQKYWKPIIESIGHFYIEDVSTLIISSKSILPDIPRDDATYVIEGWNLDTKQVRNVNLSFRGDKPIWIFEESEGDLEDCLDIIVKNNTVTKMAKIESRYTEQDYLNALVECIDSNLESIYGRKGAVIQVIPAIDFIEIDVDFGRGIGIVRLTEKQIEISNEI